jgi:hypothetical protein
MNFSRKTKINFRENTKTKIFVQRYVTPQRQRESRVKNTKAFTTSDQMASPMWDKGITIKNASAIEITYINCCDKILKTVVIRF